jgi:hypothetical protein
MWMCSRTKHRDGGPRNACIRFDARGQRRRGLRRRPAGGRATGPGRDTKRRFSSQAWNRDSAPGLPIWATSFPPIVTAGSRAVPTRSYSVSQTDNTARVRDGYIRLSTRGHARAR